jgi:hypothetical protein
MRTAICNSFNMLISTVHDNPLFMCKAGASTEGGVDAACVQFGSGGEEFCRQGGKCPERLRYMRGGREGGLRPPPAGGSTPLCVSTLVQSVRCYMEVL